MRVLRNARLRARPSKLAKRQQTMSDGDDEDFVLGRRLAPPPRARSTRRSRANRKRKRSEAWDLEAWEPSKKIYQPPAVCVTDGVPTAPDTLDDGPVDLTGENTNSPLGKEALKVLQDSTVLLQKLKLGQLVKTPFGLGSIQGIHERSTAPSHALLERLQKQNKVCRNSYLLPHSEKVDMCVTVHYHPLLGHFLKIGSPNGGIKDFDIVEAIGSKPVGNMSVEAVKRMLMKRTETVELTILRPQPGVIPEIEATMASSDGNEKDDCSTSLSVYEVWLQWGDGCYFKQFAETKDGEQPQKHKKETFDTTWMPKLFLTADKIKLAEDTVLARVELYKDNAETNSASHDKFQRRRKKRKLITLTLADYCRLWPGVYLNDTLFDFYVSYILEHRVEERLKGKIHVFNSLFYKFMSESHSPVSVLTWTRGIDIFQKHFIIIPVNDGLHWSLAVICNPSDLLKSVTVVSAENAEAVASQHVESGQERTAPVVEVGPHKPVYNGSAVVIFLDSLKGNRTQKVLKQLRRYLQSEVELKLGGPIEKLNAKVLPGFSPLVPEQKNQCDCGLYALEFFQRLLGTDYDKFLEVIKLEFGKMRPEFAKAFGSKWFSPVDVAKRRHAFAKVLRSLQNK